MEGIIHVHICVEYHFMRKVYLVEEGCVS